MRGQLGSARALGIRYISLFIDEHMRKGVRTTSDEEVDSLLDKVVMLFRYLQARR